MTSSTKRKLFTDVNYNVHVENANKHTVKLKVLPELIGGGRENPEFK